MLSPAEIEQALRFKYEAIRDQRALLAQYADRADAPWYPELKQALAKMIVDRDRLELLYEVVAA